jgi:CRP/FNR family transcriptional regulator, anaerobic regulatory protein
MGSEALDPVRVLLSTYVFQDLSPAEVEPLAKAVRVREYRRGEYLFHAGDPADFLHVVANGQIKNSMTTKDGDEFIYDVLTQGGVFGEPGIFSREHNRVLDAVAMERSTVIDIPREQLVDFMQRHRPVMMRILAGSPHRPVSRSRPSPTSATRRFASVWSTNSCNLPPPTGRNSRTTRWRSR